MVSYDAYVLHNSVVYSQHSVGTLVAYLKEHQVSS